MKLKDENKLKIGINKGKAERMSYSNEPRPSIVSLESPNNETSSSPPRLKHLIKGPYQNIKNSSETPEVCLEDLWRFGIPVNIRKGLWPFKIENKLGISYELYRMNMHQGIKLKQRVM